MSRQPPCRGVFDPGHPPHHKAAPSRYAARGRVERVKVIGGSFTPDLGRASAGAISGDLFFKP